MGKIQKILRFYEIKNKKFYFFNYISKKLKNTRNIFTALKQSPNQQTRIFC